MTPKEKKNKKEKDGNEGLESRYFYWQPEYKNTENFLFV